MLNNNVNVSVLCLTGYTGVGKSTLAAKIKAAATPETHVHTVYLGTVLKTIVNSRFGNHVDKNEMRQHYRRAANHLRSMDESYFASYALRQIMDAEATAKAAGAKNLWVVIEDLRCLHDYYFLKNFYDAELLYCEVPEEAPILTGTSDPLTLEYLIMRDYCKARNVSFINPRQLTKVTVDLMLMLHLGKYSSIAIVSSKHMHLF